MTSKVKSIEKWVVSHFRNAYDLTKKIQPSDFKISKESEFNGGSESAIRMKNLPSSEELSIFRKPVVFSVFHHFDTPTSSKNFQDYLFDDQNNLKINDNQYSQ